MKMTELLPLKGDTFILSNDNGGKLTDFRRDVDSPSEDFPSRSRKHLATSENFFLNTGVGTLKY